jgi:hypothetical protein
VGASCVGYVAVALAAGAGGRPDPPLARAIDDTVLTLGPRAAVVAFSVDRDAATFAVVPSDERLYVQRYRLGPGGPRSLGLTVEPLARGDLRAHPIRLESLSGSSLGALYARLRVSPAAASAALSGRTWTIRAHGAAWQARFDGRDLHRVAGLA